MASDTVGRMGMLAVPVVRKEPLEVERPGNTRYIEEPEMLKRL